MRVASRGAGRGDTRSLAARVALAAALLAAASAGAAPTAGAAEPRPNVIVVMTDDQTVSELKRWVMPETDAALRRQGTAFTNATVSSPLCCPSRAGFLTGSYAHNNGVFDNEPGYRGLTPNGSTLFTWLQANGYRTGHIGRFLLGYPSDPTTLQGALAPPGVDRWFGYVDQATLYYNALFSDDGILGRTGFDPSGGYTTNVINREATDFVSAAAPSPKPFFLWVAHIAPHTTNRPQYEACGGGAPIPEPGTFSRFAAQRLPRPPSFNEKRISDKPRWVRSRRRLSPERLNLIRRGWRCALASLTAVDRGIGALVTRLAELGELDDTAIFFTSDNGLTFGEHRLVQAKSYPYEEVLRVPLLARIPSDYLGGASAPREIDKPVTNLDLTATILELTGTLPCLLSSACHSIDGRSLVPLLRGDSAGWPKRRATLVELGNRTCVRDPNARNGLETFYDAIRTANFFYVELHHVNATTGLCDRDEYELYNLRRDPFQLENIAVNPEHRKASSVQRELARRLAALRACAGVEGRDVAVGGRPFCE